MVSFWPPISFACRGLALLVIAIIAFVAAVAFFLYEKLEERSVVGEILISVAAALILSLAVFFALLRADILI
jgi:hypothetical protein